MPSHFSEIHVRFKPLAGACRNRFWGQDCILAHGAMNMSHLCRFLDCAGYHAVFQTRPFGKALVTCVYSWEFTWENNNSKMLRFCGFAAWSKQRRRGMPGICVGRPLQHACAWPCALLVLSAAHSRLCLLFLRALHWDKQPFHSQLQIDWGRERSRKTNDKRSPQVLWTDLKRVEVVWRLLGPGCIFGILQSPGDLLGWYAFAFSGASFHRTDLHTQYKRWKHTWLSWSG